jgi:hypothetical protein
MSDETVTAPKAVKSKKTTKKTARKPRKAGKIASASPSAKGKPWTFPKNTLEDAIRIPKEIEEKNAGNPMPVADLATAVGFRLANDWRFLDLLRSADQYDWSNVREAPSAFLSSVKTLWRQALQASGLKP